MSATTPTIEITFDGTAFKEVIKMKLMEHTMECNMGEVFTHDAPELGGKMTVSYCVQYIS